MKRFVAHVGFLGMAFAAVGCGVDSQTSSTQGMQSSVGHARISVPQTNTVEENDASCKAALDETYSYKRGSEVVILPGKQKEISVVMIVRGKAILVESPERVGLKSISCVRAAELKAMAAPSTVVVGGGSSFKFINVDVHSSVAENDAACKEQAGAEFSYQQGSEVVMTRGGDGAITPVTVNDKVIAIPSVERITLKQIKCVKK